MLYTKFERYLMLRNRCFVADRNMKSTSEDSEFPDMQEKEVLELFAKSKTTERLFTSAFVSLKST